MVQGKFFAGALVFASLFFIILPEKIGGVEKMSVFSIAFLLASGFLLASFCVWIKNKVGDRINARTVEKNAQIAKEKRIAYVENEIASLDEHEKANLREFRMRRQRTLRMLLDDPVVSGLRFRGVLEGVLANGNFIPSLGNVFNLSISPDFDERLDDKSIGLPMSDEEFASRRPQWVWKYEDCIQRWGGFKSM
ncbi:MAG: superinfection exclusion B family protein [Fibromonadaceae bacterium]|jgi:hypothetical protein|nr:superinfection exclusion B family protein [Fibromonadaceae bacterium]